MKKVGFIIAIALLFAFSLKAQRKITVVLGIDYMKDTVTILYNSDTLFHRVIESDFNAHRTAEFEFTRKKQGGDFLRVHINEIKVAVSLKDYKKLRSLRINCIPNPLNTNDKEIRIYKIK